MSNIQTLLQWLIGDFSNVAQALNQPVYFVNTYLWHRQLPTSPTGNPFIFAEQAGAISMHLPYRQRLFELIPRQSPESISLQYYACISPSQWQGAATEPERLTKMSLADLERLPGCQLTARWTGKTFKTAPVPGRQCSFEYDGQTRYVELEFEVGETFFFSGDRGVDPNTGEALWGAIDQPYQYLRV